MLGADVALCRLEQLEIEATEEVSGGEPELLLGQLEADAVAAAAAEGHPVPVHEPALLGRGGARRVRRGQPPLRLEPFRIGEDVCIVVQVALRHGHDGAGRERVRLRVRAGRRIGHWAGGVDARQAARDGGGDAKRLLDDCRQVG